MRTLVRLFLLRRLFERGGRGRRSAWGYGYRGRPSYGWGYRRPRSQVRVTGCCLPLPLTLVLGVVGAARAFARR